MASAPVDAGELDDERVGVWARELDLPEAVVRSLCGHYAQLVDWLRARQAALGRPLLVGVSGAQGTGKSTLVSLCMRLLQQRGGLRAAGLSLDDFYLTRAERLELAARVHPLLATRGAPGTHDLAMLRRALDVLTGAQPGQVSVPRFDKASDDRAGAHEPASWPRLEGPVDVVLLEGWCVGARPQPEALLSQPINALERAQDPDGRFVRHVDAQLRGPYRELSERLDVLVMLRAPDMACVRSWRLEQERALSRKLLREGRADTTLDAAAVERFVQFFERVTRAMLDEMPARADVLIELDQDHGIRALHYRSASAGECE